MLLIDLTPRGETGWDLLEQLHIEGVTSRVPVVVTSTLPSILERVQQERDRYGGDKLITKPLDIDTLLGAIRDPIGPAEPSRVSTSACGWPLSSSRATRH